MRSTLSTLAERLALATALLFALALWLPSAWLPTTDAPAPRTMAAATVTEPPAATASHLEARPLFDPERGAAKPMAEDAAPQLEGFAQSYDLRGVLRTEAATIALLENRASKTTERVTEGQELDTWELKEIGDGTVTFRNGADEAVFKLQASEKPAAVAAEQ
jgi:hypothetical protein